jgi:hypothetical protein
MNRDKAVRMMVLTCASLLTLGGCFGADSVASPGVGTFPPPPPPPAPPPPPPPPPPPIGPAADCPTGFANVGVIADLRNCQLPQNISGSLVVPKRAGTIYSVSGRTSVGVDLGANPASPLPAGVRGVLTIEPGVRIFGSGGLDYLLVQRGSQIFAEGTAAEPIILTSRQSVLGTTGVDSIGQWGGMIINGRAPISLCPTGVTPPNAACEAQIEGSNALYGGNSVADNSGILRFVRMQHSGFEILPGNELNGITFGGVGTGTLVENVQVHNSSDDGIEMFGGTVNLRNIVLTGNDDDSYDTDTGFVGALQNLIVVQRSAGGDRAFEMSSAGNKNASTLSFPKIANATIVTRSSSSQAIILNSDTRFSMVNSVVTRGASGHCLRVDGAGTGAGTVRFNSVFFSCPNAFSTSSDSIGSAAIAALFNAGANNTANGTSTLTNGFVNGANENAVAVTNPTTESPFFTATGNIGASGTGSTWWSGWSCGLPGGTTC